MSAQLTHEGIQARATQPATAVARGRLRGAWHRLRLTAAEMNYASRRVVELQAPWSALRTGRRAPPDADRQAGICGCYEG
jgi:hypothetical protein